MMSEWTVESEPQLEKSVSRFWFFSFLVGRLAVEKRETRNEDTKENSMIADKPHFNDE